VRQRIGSRRAGRLHIEFLQHLDRQRVAAAIDERDGATTLGASAGSRLMEYSRILVSRKRRTVIRRADARRRATTGRRP
jgi:hypothetical protein